MKSVSQKTLRLDNTKYLEAFVVILKVFCIGQSALSENE